ncbi:uncharacterized protein LOC114649910 [Erpetoichthys calabaricus]|uniref:uncharacterized protein LOC114649910 n=1 Tax=Erpetoichthys calabaricus TaxID=27687 RepID=UPI00223407DF|nr:uncharacterized protein LOC114649910 [Erpetoichthys calabaricus]
MMMWLQGQAVLPLFLLVWLTGMNCIIGAEGSTGAWKEDSNPTEQNLNSENVLAYKMKDSFISPVLSYDEVVTSYGFEGGDKDGSGDLMYQDFEVLDVDEGNVPMKQKELNIGVVSHDMKMVKAVKAINYNQKAVVGGELSDPVVNADVPHGDNLEELELLQDRADYDNEYSGAWSPELESYRMKLSAPPGQVCHEVAVFPYKISCGQMSMSAEFFGSPADLKVRLNSSFVQVTRIAHQCKYKMEMRTGSFIFTAYYDGCNVQKIKGCYVLTLLWQNEKVSLACPGGEVSSPLPPAVLCNETSMTVGLPSGSPDDLKVKADHLHWVPARHLARRCKYVFLKDAFGRIFFTVSYKGCFVKREGSYHILSVRYTSPNHKENVLDMRCPIHYGEHVTTPHSTVPPLSHPKVSCHVSTMDVLLPGATPDQVKVKDHYNREVGVQQLAKKCHYHLLRSGYDLVFSASYKSCHVRMEGNHYILTVVYKASSGLPVLVHMKCPSSHWDTTTAPVATSPRKPSPLCKASSMSVLLPPGSLDQVKVLDNFHHEVLVHTAPKSCGYHLMKKPHGILFESPYQACHVQTVNHYYTLTVLYKPTPGPQIVVNMRCPRRYLPIPLSTAIKPSTPRPPHLACRASSMSIELPSHLMDEVKVLDEAHYPVVVMNAPKECQYHLEKRGKTIVFTAGYRSCHVHSESSNYVLVVLYTPENGGQERVTMKCPIHAVPTSSPATSRPPVLYSTSCEASGMTLMLPGGSFNQIKLIDKSNRMVPVMELPRDCGYSLLKAGGHLLLTAGYKACDIRIQDNHYTLTVIYRSATGDRRVHMKCPVQLASTVLPTMPVHPHPTCTASGMTVVLPSGSLDQVKIIDQLGQETAVSKAPKHCGYKLVKGKGTITFSASYRACGIKVQNHHYILHLSYKPAIGNAMTVTLSCPVGGDPLKTTTPATSTRRPSHMECMTSSMAVVLPVESPNAVYVVDGSGHDVHVISAPKTCGYALEEKGEMLVLTALYKACHVTVQHAHYVLEVRYKSGRDKTHSVTMKCPVPRIPPPTLATSTHSPSLVSCHPSSMSVVLPVEFPEQVTILGLHGEEKRLSFAPKECGYTVVKSMGKISLTVLYISCGVHKVENFFVLNLRYYPTVGHPVAVQMKCPAIHVHPTSPRPSPTVTADPRVLCHLDSMSVELPNGKLEDIKLMDKAHHLLVVLHAPKECQYHLVKRSKSIVFTAGYRSCHVHTEHSSYVLVVLYTPENGVQKRVTMKCPIHAVPTSSPATSRPPVLYSTTCEISGMRLMLPGGSFNQIKLIDKSNRMVPVVELPRDCGYSLLKAGGHLLLTAGYKACDIRIQDNHYTLTVIYRSATGDRRVHMKCPVQQTSTVLPTMPVHPHPTCTASGMTVVLPYGSLDELRIIDQLGQVIVISKAPKHCGYKLVKGKGSITFSASYRACGIKVENHHYILHLSYKPAIGNAMTVTLSCPVGGDPLKTTTPPTSTRRPSHIACMTSSMAVVLPVESPNDVYVVDGSGHDVHVISAPKICGYALEEKGEMLVLTAPYKACHVTVQHGHYVLEVRYKSGREKIHSLTMKCPVPRVPLPTLATSTHSPSLVSCHPSSMSVVLPVEFPEQVTILGLHGDEKLLSFAPKECGYTVVKSMGKISLTALYTSCGAHKEENFFVLNLHYYPTVGLPVAVQMKCPAIHVHPTPPRPSPPVSADPRVVCHLDHMSIELPNGKMEDIKLKDKMGKLVPVYQTSKSCGYHIVKAEKISLLIPYKACDVKIMDHHYSLVVAYTPTNGVQRKITVQCPVIGKPPSPLEAGVSCHEDCMSIDLPAGPLDQVKVLDEHHNAVAIKQSVHCGYNLSSGVGKLHFSAYYKACHVKIQNGHHVLTVLYTTLGLHGEVQLKCPVHDLVFHQGCDLPRKKQVQCGPTGIAPSVCHAKGCCVDPQTSHCFYPLDTCTADGHFVFAVYRTSSKPDVDPGSLYVSNHSCAPVICTLDFAVFKIPLTGCGTHRFVIGETSVYLADVFGKKYKNRQMYGQILRHAPYHSQIECRYSKGTHASTGYMVVNSPALSDVVSSGALGVVLRIAKDDSYTTFFQDTQVPLRFLLGSKIHLEVKMVNPPTPELVLLVHYCIAYPRSSENVWVLMYNGCPNVLDYGTGLHLKDHNWQPVPKHTRRFDVTTFQFMDAKENLLDEEIYFMCSTEICSHKESCVEGCFDGRQMTVPQSEWGRLCAGKPCPRQLHVKRAIADHGSLLWREEPSSQEN